jgi:hypothetical protein
MTMPHLMNCDHSETGWCLKCVKALYDEKCDAVIEARKYEYALQATTHQLKEIAHDRAYKAIGLLEVPARVGMLVAEVKQLRYAMKSSHQLKT